MASVSFFLTLIVIVGVASAVPSTYSALPVREHRSELRPLKPFEEIPYNYEYYIVPANENSVVEYVPPSDTSDWSLSLPNPITAIATVGSKALAVAKFLIVNGGLVVLGVALVVGFCAFTSYCTLIIEKPFAREIRSLNIPYLDDVEYYLQQAYEKYHEL